jgi:hypothetical protein
MIADDTTAWLGNPQTNRANVPCMLRSLTEQNLILSLTRISALGGAGWQKLRCV